MEFNLTAEQQLMCDSVRRLVARDIDPLLSSHDINQTLPKSAYLSVFAKIAALGLTAARLPASAGGPGITTLDYGIMLEQIPAPVAVSLIAQEVTVARLYTECNESQRQRFLPDLIAGRKIACTGSTEPGTGSDPRGIQARVTGAGDALKLSGRKMWITNVSACDVMLVTCLDCRDGQPGNRVIKVVLERHMSPFESREIDTVGIRQGMLGEAVFEGCHVPAENLLLSEGGGTQVLKASWAINRPLFGLLAVQMAQKAYDIALEYAKSRQQFGKAIGAHQLVQKNLSDIVTSITTSRLLCYYALAQADQGMASDGAAAMAKRYAQNACQEAVWQAMNVLGAMGLATEARIEALYRDIRMIAIPDGTNEILTLIHGRELTGLSAIRG